MRIRRRRTHARKIKDYSARAVQEVRGADKGTTRP